MSTEPSPSSDDGYPSWLPRRPPPPGPIQHGLPAGRKPTPRSVRIVNLEPAFHAPPKVWTRASGPPPPTALTSADLHLPLPQPRFNAKNLHIQLLRSPSRWMKAYFYLWPLVVFYHIPLQSFFDFNAVYILLQVTKYPSPDSSSRSWALGTTAYIACWLVWILIVFLTYEVIYSFVRRWRLRRPLILPIYLSSPAFNMAALSSYSTFSFLQHIRLSALSHEHADAIAPLPTHSYSKVHSRSDSQDEKAEDPDTLPTTSTASLSQFLAETCYFYSQNLPSVGLLLPRTGLCLALLLSFSTPIPDGNGRRDATFFNSTDGTLTDYAKGILIANAAWTAWRTCVLLVSWLGLWLFSSNRLAGICGPRHIWEEHSQEKTRSVYSSAASEHGARSSWLYHHPGSVTTGRSGGVYHADAYQGQLPLHDDGNRRTHADAYYEPGPYAGDELPWEWREHTRMRVQDAFEFCLASDGRYYHSRGRSGSDADGFVWGSVPRRGGKKRSKGKERSGADGDEDAEEGDGRTRRGRGFEGIEKVLAAIGFGGAVPSSPSGGARRGALTRDLFDTPEPEVDEALVLDAGPSTLPLLKTPKVAKRNSKDKDTIQHDISLVSIAGHTPPQTQTPSELVPPLTMATAAAAVPSLGAPLLSLPYPFTQPGAGRVSSRDGELDLVPFPAVGGAGAGVDVGRQSRGSRSTSSSGSGTTGSGSGTGTGTGTGEDDAEQDGEEDEDDDDDDDDEEEEEEEEASGGRRSESMSSLGQPISPSRGHPMLSGRARARGQGHTRNASGVSSGLSRSSGTGPRTQGRRSISSGATGTGSFSGGAYSYRYSYSAASGASGVRSLEVESEGRVVEEGDGVSVGSRSTGNNNRSTSESGSSGCERGVEGGASGIPMPPRHPNLQGGSQVLGQVQQGQGGQQGRTRKVAISTPSPSSSSSERSGFGSGSSARLGVPVPAVVQQRASPVVFPSAGERMRRGRVDSGPVVVGGGIGSDVEGRYEDRVGFEGYEWDGGEEGGEEEEEEEEEMGEREDRLGLLVPSPRVSMVSVAAGGVGIGTGTGNGNGGRSRTHSLHSIISSTTSSSRSRTHSSHSHSSRSNAPSVRERASSVGHSVRSLVVAAGTNLGVGIGAGRGPRSRVNSSLSMARLEEEREDVGEFGERARGVVGDVRETEGGGNASPTASHSRSGSESVSGENYTFGRPVAFMRSSEGVETRQERVDEGDEEGEEGDVVVVVVERSAVGRVGDGDGDEEEQSEYRRGGVDIPGRHRVPHRLRHQDPDAQRQLELELEPSSLPTTNISSASRADISSAPGSFVTAPPSFIESGEGGVGGSSSASVLGRVGGDAWRVA